MKKYFLLIFLGYSVLSCNPETEVTQNSLPMGDYFSEVADTTAQLFGEGFVSQHYQN